MDVYAKSLASADKLIRKYGGLVDVLRPTSSGAANPSKPWAPSAVSVTDVVLATAVHMVMLDASEMRGSQKNPMVLTPDIVAVGYMSPLETEAQGLADVRVGDLVAGVDRTYQVVEYQPYKPGDEVVLHTVHLRG